MEVLLTGPAETTLTAQCDSELASVINIAKLRQAQSTQSAPCAQPYQRSDTATEKNTSLLV